MCVCTYLQVPLHDLLGARVGVLVEPLVEEAELAPREAPAEDEHELFVRVGVRVGCVDTKHAFVVDPS